MIEIIPRVIAHRGASGYAPENTLIAFIKAAQLGIKWVEFDVMQSACGEPIIFHDHLLERTTNGKGVAEEYPYSFLRTLDAGRWFHSRFSGEAIPSLAQVMNFLSEANVSANVEIKEVILNQEALVVRVLDELKPFLAENKIKLLFSSFSFDALYFLRQHSPDCLLGLLLHDYTPNWQALAESLNCVSINVNHEVMTPEWARAIKNLGKTLLCYTVNDVERAKELYAFGVDAVFSDFPDKMI